MLVGLLPPWATYRMSLLVVYLVSSFVVTLMSPWQRLTALRRAM